MMSNLTLLLFDLFTEIYSEQEMLDSAVSFDIITSSVYLVLI